MNLLFLRISWDQGIQQTRTKNNNQQQPTTTKNQEQPTANQQQQPTGSLRFHQELANLV
jgi:hypothetical protein